MILGSQLFDQYREALALIGLLGGTGYLAGRVVVLAVQRVLPLRRAWQAKWDRWLDATFGAKFDERLNRRNGGHSIRDQLDRLERSVGDLHRCVDQLDQSTGRRFAELDRSSRERFTESASRAERIEQRVGRIEGELMRRQQP